MMTAPRHLSVCFCGQPEAEEISGYPTGAIVSITNPGEAAALKVGWGAVLRVQFWDSAYDEEDIRRLGPAWERQSSCFPARRHAEEIRRFIEALPPQIEFLVVHCGAGVSRSAAVAKWAAERYGAVLDRDAERCNRTVYALLLDPGRFDAVLSEVRPPRPPTPRWRSVVATILGWAR